MTTEEMKLVVVSYKVCWFSPEIGKYVTHGGFPFQMHALSELFDQTTLIIALRNSPKPSGTSELDGHNLTVSPLPEPAGQGVCRKFSIITWLPRHLPSIWHAIRQADAVHAPVPGDLGLIGILVALAQRKPLFVRHCGTWGEPVSITDRFLFWLLERIAGGCNVVLATGGADHPPSCRNPNIRWIFSTTLTEKEWVSITPAQPWNDGMPIKLVTVGRLSIGKNTAELIRALPIVQKDYPQLHLDILGEGPCLADLRKLSTDLHLDHCITFHGNVSHTKVMEKLSQSHLFVFPTRVKEGFPKALLEAMACGLPVIATDVSVIPYLLKNNAGELLNNTDAQAIASTILSVLSNSTQMEIMGKNARASSRRFTIENWKEEIRSALEFSWNKKFQT